jgi:hypothetical protein
MSLESFENVRLRPIVMTDCGGERHEVHFRMRLLGSMVALEAFELIAGMPGGYQFETIGKSDDEPLPLLGRLIERIRRSLAVKHLVRTELGAQIADMRYGVELNGMKLRTAGFLSSLSTVRKCLGKNLDVC